MTKKSWDKFSAEHPASPAFVAKVSSSLPRQFPVFDKSQRKFPTPYRLLVEWLKAKLVGDWASTTAKDGLVFVRVANEADILAITQRFPRVGQSSISPASPNTIQINYSDSDYSKLADELGYKFS